MTLRHRILAAAPLFLLLGAAGPLQPQTTTGPCTVRGFLIVSFGTSNTTMTTTPGGTCEFTVINPDLQVFPTAALVTARPTHGEATSGLVNGGRSAAIRYVPSPGFTGRDKFTVTIEPGDKAIIVTVAVAPPPR